MNKKLIEVELRTEVSINDVENLKKDLAGWERYYLAQKDSLLCSLGRLMTKKRI